MLDYYELVSRIKSPCVDKLSIVWLCPYVLMFGDSHDIL